MLKTAIFIDYQNFIINLKKHFGERNQDMKWQDLTLIGKEVNERVGLNAEVTKTYLFASEPSDCLMQLEKYQKISQFLKCLDNKPFFEVIRGRQEIRAIKGKAFDVNDPDTFYTTEKETDTNLATTMLVKAFHNSYDVAILFSGDTDYINVVKALHDIGKIVILAVPMRQNVDKYNGIVDCVIRLDDDILDKCELPRT